jgi:hypothetical protein
MAQTKERQASALTLAAQRRDTETLILRALGRNTSANAPASMAMGLAAPLAAGLADGADATNEATMDTRLPKSRVRRDPNFTRQAAKPGTRKPAALRAFLAIGEGGRALRQPGPILREPGPVSGPPGAASRPALALGRPLNIDDVAEMLGCSPWTVRQTLIPRGLPHFRFRASGRLTFYRDQVIRWIENQQGGNKTS